MPIPTAQAHDVALAYLMLRGGTAPFPASTLEQELEQFLRAENAIGFEATRNGHMNPALASALATLEDRMFIDYKPQEDVIQLTGLGTYVAQLYAIPSRLRAFASAAQCRVNGEASKKCED